MMSRPIVIQRHPNWYWHLLGVVALLFGIGFLSGIWFSVSQGIGIQDPDELRLRELQQEVENLHQWREDYRTRREVNAKALELVRGELASQHETIAELERDLYIYKSLAAPADLAEGLHIHSVEFTRNGQSDRYQFRVLVQQQSVRKNRTMTGTLRVQLVGHRNGKETKYHLARLSKEVSRNDIRLRFRYFQEIKGELKLPDGFVPQFVRASAKSTAPLKSEDDEEYPWAVQERIGYVRQ